VLQSEDVKVLLATIRAMHRMCSRVIDSGDLMPPSQSAIDAGLLNSNNIDFHSDNLETEQNFSSHGIVFC